MNNKFHPRYPDYIIPLELEIGVWRNEDQTLTFSFRVIEETKTFTIRPKQTPRKARTDE